MSGMDWQKGTLIIIVVCLFIGVLVLSSQALFRSDIWREPTWAPNPADFSESEPASQPVSQNPFLPATRAPGTPAVTPTPELPQVLPTVRSDSVQYTIQSGDTLAELGWQYAVSVESILQANNLEPGTIIHPGQVLVIPPAIPQMMGPDFKIIPDSELVYGPVSTLFDTGEIIRSHNGYLANYQEEVDGQWVDSTYIVDRVADEYSVNPRLLLAILEKQCGWLTQNPEGADYDYYPLGFYNEQYAGLFRQLSWAADSLNKGYYSWRNNAVSTWILADGQIVSISPTINAGTAAVQYIMGQLMGAAEWYQVVTENGFIETYRVLFGYPFDLSIEPIVPENLQQPAMQLPFMQMTTWSFTGAPHAAFGSGSAWAALDFAPPGESQGCAVSRDWVVAVADGLITRSDLGVVTLDLDGDGKNQTGWSILYLHIASHERVAPGTQVKAGDNIGHASCEGGLANASHVHVARRYNGEWIPADGDIPFIMDGWVPESAGTEYDGYLKKNDTVIEAWDSYRTENQISR